tara:strand:+ start:2026 stop:2457 length:432 start_codon:yes stop_codon:yes gene_type:complete
MNFQSPPVESYLNKFNTPSPKKNIQIPNAPGRIRRLQIKEKNLEENDFILDIDNFNIRIENYTLKIYINLIFFNKELNIIYNTKNINIDDIDKLNDIIIIEYTENNYFLLNYYDNNNNCKYYQLKFIDINDTSKLKLIYKKLT